MTGALLLGLHGSAHVGGVLVQVGLDLVAFVADDDHEILRVQTARCGNRP